MNIFIIGSGNIAEHLTKAIAINGIYLSGIYSRNEIEVQKIASKWDIPWYDKITSIPKNADIYLICISDDAIKIVVEQLPKSIKKSKIIAHTSGSKSIIETLEGIKNAGVFYPLQTFTKGKKMIYQNIPFCINGTNKKTKITLSELANRISKSVLQIDDERRKSIHLSAVMINNFVNHIIFASQNLLEQQGIDTNILQPLLKETISKQKKLGALEAQTGPARRLDAQTLGAHLDLLRHHKAFKAMYMTISKSIQKTYKDKL